jgi:hypothetical protein
MWKCIGQGKGQWGHREAKLLFRKWNTLLALQCVYQAGSSWKVSVQEVLTGSIFSLPSFPESRGWDLRFHPPKRPWKGEHYPKRQEKPTPLRCKSLKNAVHCGYTNSKVRWGNVLDLKLELDKSVFQVTHAPPWVCHLLSARITHESPLGGRASYSDEGKPRSSSQPQPMHLLPWKHPHLLQDDFWAITRWLTLTRHFQETW